MQLPKPYHETGGLNVIIETPKGSNFKHNYDPALQGFRLAKLLPVGMHFPYDFGFIPGTRGEDGDPLDILVLSPYPLFVGCVVTVHLISVLKAEQTEKEGSSPIRNDRLVGTLQADSGERVEKLSPALTREIEAFFIQYNRLEGKQFQPLGWGGSKQAYALVEAGIKT